MSTRWHRLLDPPTVRRLSVADRDALRAAVDAIAPEVPAVAQEVSRNVLVLQPELVDPGDEAAVAALHRATIANVGAIVSTLAFAVPPGGLDVPDGVLDLLDYVARNPAGLSVMLRAYRLGEAGFQQLWLAHLGGFVQDTRQFDRLARHSLDHIAVYVDRISEVIAARWESVVARVEREGRRREAALRSLLAGEPVDVQALDHPVDSRHLVLAVHPRHGGLAESLLRDVQQLCHRAPMLEVGLGDGTTVVWLAMAEPEATVDAVLRLIDTGWAVATATGPGLEELAAGAADARDSLAALKCVRPAGGVARHAELALTAALLADPRRAKRLVRSVLGPLAEPTARNLDLCDTLRAYFEAGERKAGAAALLGVHVKTVAHRLSRAEALLGVTVGERRAALESALILHRLVIPPGVRNSPKSH